MGDTLGVGGGRGSWGGVGREEVGGGLQDEGYVVKASLGGWSSESKSSVTFERSQNFRGDGNKASIVMDDSTPSSDREMDAPKPPTGLHGLSEIKPAPATAHKKDESEGPEPVFGSEAFMNRTRKANGDGSRQ
jgi:hypothetical protein